MDSSMSKDHATRLIRELIGPELDRECHIQLTPDEAEGLTSEQKEFHYSQLLAGVQFISIQNMVSSVKLSTKSFMLIDLELNLSIVTRIVLSTQ